MFKRFDKSYFLDYEQVVIAIDKLKNFIIYKTELFNTGNKYIMTRITNVYNEKELKTIPKNYTVVDESYLTKTADEMLGIATESYDNFLNISVISNIFSEYVTYISENSITDTFRNFDSYRLLMLGVLKPQNINSIWIDSLLSLQQLFNYKSFRKGMIISFCYGLVTNTNFVYEILRFLNKYPYVILDRLRALDFFELSLLRNLNIVNLELRLNNNDNENDDEDDEDNIDMEYENTKLYQLKNIKNINKLKTLDISGTNKFDVCPEDFKFVEELKIEKLELNFCSLTKILKHVKLPNTLKSLKLYSTFGNGMGMPENKLSGLSFCKNLINLEELEFNNIINDDVYLNDIMYLSKLKKLHIRDSFFSDIKVFQYLTELEELTLHSYEGDSSVLGKLKKLKNLNISHLRSYEFLKELNGLETLSISRITYEELNLNYIKNVKNLSIYFLDNVNIVDNLDFLIPLENSLTELFLHGCKLLNIDAIGKLTKLTSLSLHTQYAESLDFTPLKNLNNLKHLNSSRNIDRIYFPKNLVSLNHEDI